MTPPKHPDDENPHEDHKHPKDPKVEQAKKFINQYQKVYKNVDPQVLLQLSALKNITNRGKHEKPERAFKDILDHLGEQESHETLRQERWHGKVRCPYCKSYNVKRLPITPEENPDNYRYQCYVCHKEFNDDSETKIEGGTPPLHTWMFCWYLLGCTDSFQYIANKLGLSLAVVEMMVRHMQKLFKSEQPLKHFMSYEEWALKHGKGYKSVIQEALAKERLFLTGDTPYAPVDTGEHRRKQEIRRNPGKKPGPKYTPK